MPVGLLYKGKVTGVDPNVPTVVYANRDGVGAWEEGTLIDWGNARVAPAALDLATLRAQGAVPPPWFAEPPGRDWADVHVHVQYLGFAADHLGAARVGEMIATATAARARLR